MIINFEGGIDDEAMNPAFSKSGPGVLHNCPDFWGSTVFILLGKRLTCFRKCIWKIPYSIQFHYLRCDWGYMKFRLKYPYVNSCEQLDDVNWSYIQLMVTEVQFSAISKGHQEERVYVYISHSVFDLEI